MQWWDWASIIMGSFGVLAFAMGIRPFAQMIWGPADLKTQFELFAQGVERCLVIFLENPPIRNRVLKRLAKRQSFDSISAQYKISEAGSGTILLPIRQVKIYSYADSDANGRWQTDLPPTYSVGASITLVMWDHSMNAAVLPPGPGQTQEAIVLGPGLYLAEIILSTNGEPRHFSEVFNVGEGPDDLYWALDRAT